MGKLSTAIKGFSLVSGLKSIGSILKGAFSSLGSALKGLKGVTVLKWGSITAGISGVFYGIYSGIKGAVQTVSDGGTSTVKEIFKVFGVELSDSQSMMIFVAIIVVAIIGIVVWYRRRKSRR